MIIVMKQGAPREEIDKIEQIVRMKGLQVDESKGTTKMVMGLVGDTSVIDAEQLLGNDYVEKVMIRKKEAAP